MRFLVSAILFLFLVKTFAATPQVVLSVGADTVMAIKQQVSSNIEILSKDKEQAIIRIAEDKIIPLSGLMHIKFGRCPGFMRYDSIAAAYEFIATQKLAQATKGIFNLDYSLTEQDRVEAWVSQIEELSLLQIIVQLSSYKTRYHTSETAQQAVKWLKAHWEKMAKNRSDIKVEFIKHQASPMPSVMMTISGTEDPDQVVIVGGHADSIARSFFGGLGKVAPGADDNASGIATMSEVIRVLMDNSYRPKKTVKFIAYAAEEVGLYGSREIAQDFRNRGVNVIGVIQLDMTNFKGSDADIVLMDDYTNDAQNTFVKKLIDRYVRVKWGVDRCGYGCSDHASWTAMGYPASMPFESKVREMNHKIHSKNDTLKISNNHAFHAVKFAKNGFGLCCRISKIITSYKLA